MTGIESRDSGHTCDTNPAPSLETRANRRAFSPTEANLLTADRSGNTSPALLTPNGTLSSNAQLPITRNKSTGNLVQKPGNNTANGRIRFSFDAGPSTAHGLIKSPRPEQENVLGVSGLRRIRRQAPPAPVRTLSLLPDDPNFLPSPLSYNRTFPTSAAVSIRSVSAQDVPNPTSPALEDLHRFPSESLHSFSFARQSEDFLHSRQNIINKSVEFMRDRMGWVANPGVASAQARLSDDSEVRGMVDLLRKANVLGIDTSDKTVRGLGIGPVTGPAHLAGNVFEKSFNSQFLPVEEALMSPPLEDETPPNEAEAEDGGSSGLEMDEGVERSRSRPSSRRSGLKRTYTDVASISIQQKLVDALAQPYNADEPSAAQSLLGSSFMPITMSLAQGDAAPSVHSHSSKAPAAQAFFRTDAKSPWTINSANDLACLIFGLSRAEVRSLDILELIAEDRRPWLQEKLCGRGPHPPEKPASEPPSLGTNGKTPLVGARGGITAKLLSKAPSRVKPSQRSQTDDGTGGHLKAHAVNNHNASKSRGVLLCGDVMPITKRNGTTSAASFWVMEKRGGLIWVLEEIIEHVAYLKLDENGCISEARGNIQSIWDQEQLESGTPITSLLPKAPVDCSKNVADSALRRISDAQHFTARTASGLNIPTSTTATTVSRELRVSSFPHIAGVMVIDPFTLKISSSNAVFCASLFGYENPEGLRIRDLIPGFDDILSALTDENDVELVDGIVVPEHSFRQIRAVLALREGKENAANLFLRPSGLPAKHRDGSEIMVDVQMRVVKSETAFPVSNEYKDSEQADDCERVAVTELVYALWITYSRQLHSASLGSPQPDHPLLSRPITPPHQPLPQRGVESASPEPALSDGSTKSTDSSQFSVLTQQLQEAAASAISDEPLEHPPPHVAKIPHPRKSINDFIILEEMGSGAYGQVKLARHRKPNSQKMVLKYVTKKRILVDTWTRDRRLGTVPLEIHVMDYLRQDGLRHPNIVEMVDFFEDDINYYIEMVPHGIPGMDLFDYIELRVNMEEEECRSIFKQVVDAIHHLHTVAKVVHRDVKDENVVLDGEGKVKLIDFGSATYIKNGPFDVFVGTIDYAAPEVLQGKAYRGKEQDVWALGILLYTIVYKENPFYNIDEIMDHPLRVPYLPFSESCIDLIRGMLDRDVDVRLTIDEVKNHAWLTEDE